MPHTAAARSADLQAAVSPIYDAAGGQARANVLKPLSLLVVLHAQQVAGLREVRRLEPFQGWAEEMVALIHADGHPMPEALGAKPFSGKFVLRVDPAFHRRLAAKALAAGESLNSYCVKALGKA